MDIRLTEPLGNFSWYINATLYAKLSNYAIQKPYIDSKDRIQTKTTSQLRTVSIVPIITHSYPYLILAFARTFLCWPLFNLGALTARNQGASVVVVVVGDCSVCHLVWATGSPRSCVVCFLHATSRYAQNRTQRMQNVRCGHTKIASFIWPSPTLSLSRLSQQRAYKHHDLHTATRIRSRNRNAI